MLQFNLLPDVKIKYIKTNRQKRLVILVATVVGAGSVALFLLMLSYVYGVQGTQISNLDKDIAKYTKALSSKSEQIDINKVLTVQNQLGALDTLHADKPVASRMYDYLAKLTPANVTISSVALSFDASSSFTLQGSTDSLESINKFIDTLKFTTYKPAPDSEPVLVFTGVVLSSFSRDLVGAGYSATMSFDPQIFSSTTQGAAGFSVPQKTTTRSELDRPVFQTDVEQANNAPEPAGGARN